MNLHIEKTTPEKEYELIDSGEGYKLERFGEVVLSRPDPQALWKKHADAKLWENADATFLKGDGKTGSWKFKGEKKEKWTINFGDLVFNIKPSPFKHVGLFPEQLSNWNWIQQKVASGLKNQKDVQVLNLFGYTGGATLAAAAAGAQVTHVDASKAAITWANENAESSGLKDKPIRWILDDALEFVKKEAKRGKRYDAIIMDPPAFGRGANGEVWKIEDNFLPFLKITLGLLSDKPLFVLINGYASGYSALTYENNLKELKMKFDGIIESGELTIEESAGGRLLPCGIFSRWSRSA